MTSAARPKNVKSPRVETNSASLETRITWRGIVLTAIIALFVGLLSAGSALVASKIGADAADRAARQSALAATAEDLRAQSRVAYVTFLNDEHIAQQSLDQYYSDAESQNIGDSGNARDRADAIAKLDEQVELDLEQVQIASDSNAVDYAIPIPNRLNQVCVDIYGIALGKTNLPGVRNPAQLFSSDYARLEQDVVGFRTAARSDLTGAPNSLPPADTGSTAFVCP